MARGNSKAQSELVDRLQAKIANREIDKELKSIGAAQTRAQEKADYEKKTGRTDVDERPWTRLDSKDYEKLASSGPLSAMKNSKLVELLTKPKTTPVGEEKNTEIFELSFKASDYNGFIGGDNYYQRLTEGGENSDGERVEYVDDDGNGYSYDDTEDKAKLPDLFVEKDGNTYQVKRSITVPIEIDEDGVLRSTATSVDDLEISFSVRQVTARPGEYVRDGRLIATYNGGEEHGAYRTMEEKAAEKNTPEYKKARQAFEAFDTQVKQWNSIVEKNPRVNQKAKLKSGEKVFEQGVGGSRRSNRFD